MKDEVFRGIAFIYVKVKLWAKFGIAILQRIQNVLSVLDRFCPPVLDCFKASNVLIPFKGYFITVHKVIVASMAIDGDQQYSGVTQVSKWVHE